MQTMRSKRKPLKRYQPDGLRVARCRPSFIEILRSPYMRPNRSVFAQTGSFVFVIINFTKEGIGFCKWE